MSESTYNNNSLLSLSRQQPKSSLNLGTVQKNQKIEYIKETGIDDDHDLQPSDEEKQNQINRLREEYIQQKLNRKKQLIKIKRQEFGSSSSEDDDVGAEESISADSQEIANSLDEKLNENVKYSVNEKDESHPLLKPQKVSVLKLKQNWTEQYLILKDTSFFLNDREIELQKIHKIKSIPQILSKNLYKMKISYFSEEIMLAISKDFLFVKKQKLAMHYIVFASIITRELEMMGLKFYPQQKTVPGVPQSIVKNSSIYGKIFKKSQILGRWQQRLIVINPMGIYSYKRFNQQHSMYIAANTVKQIWTRFEIVDQNLLVVKILHSSNTKTQFGIPITDFMNQKNWLYQFYNLGITHAKSV